MDPERQKKSAVWQYFTVKDEFTATCNTCHHDYSFRSSTSNLWKHYFHKHGKPTDTDATDFSNSDTSDGEQENSFSDRKSTWQYFEVLDSDKFEALCKLCNKLISYDSVSDLTKHVKEHGIKMVDSDDDEYQEPKKAVSGKKRFSQVWLYFRDLESDPKRAVCTLCKRILSYNATVSNLRRHLLRKHPEKKFVPYKKEYTKKIIISAEGQLYEVETEPSKVENDDEDEKDPIEMDTVYLEDLEDSMDQMPTTPQRSNETIKKESIPQKRNFMKIPKEQVKSSRYSCSEDEPPNKIKKSTHNTTMGTLDYFGQYVVSLLKGLPSSASNQLQNDIITHIFNKKISLESQDATKYAVSNSNNLDTSNDTTEPVTVTINVANDILENNESVIVESTENS